MASKGSATLAAVSRLLTTVQHLCPPAINDAIKYEEAYQRAEESFLGQWHQCCEGLDLAVRTKASLVKRASQFYFWAVACLLVPVILGPIVKQYQLTSSMPMKVEIINSK